MLFRSGKTLSLMVEGSGRDLSMLENGSVDGAIITDHPWLDEKSHKGGNRSFVEYDAFKYTQEDFNEKFRVLKEGRFLIEILPAKNENNRKYLQEIEAMAEAAGFKFYDEIPFFKDGKVSNTGRRISGQYNMVVFSKGKARNMRPNMKEVKRIFSLYEAKSMSKDEVLVELFGRTSKKDMTENFKSYAKFTDFVRKCVQYDIYLTEKYCMSGTNAILPMMIKEISTTEKHQAEKPVALYQELIKLFTRPLEIVMDQFSGSFNLEDATRSLKRHFIGFEIDTKYLAAKVESLGAGLIVDDSSLISVA